MQRTNADPPRTAMIMAAGMGTRMRPLTLDRPKPLIRLGETTLLDHVLGHVRRAGVRRIVANVHYLADHIEAHLAERASDLDVQISDERDALLETGGGLMKARPLLGDAPFFCINTDNVWIDAGEPSLARLASYWDGGAMDVLMLLVPRAHAHHHAGVGDFFCGDDGRLHRRGAACEAPYIWTGVQIIAPAILTDPPGPAFSTNIFWDRALAAGRLFGLVMEGEWFDVGTPDAIAPATAALAAAAMAEGSPAAHG